MSGKKLAVFDFDHTIVNDNTDIVVRDLLDKEEIPASVNLLRKSDGWTAYMQYIFILLQSKGVDEGKIVDAIKGIKETPGMCELIKYLKCDLNSDVIIISDSNEYFINVWLKKNNLDGTVLKVFSNPAYFQDDGLLKIQMYHYQTECKLSTKNLCKGRILREFLAAQKQNEDVDYERILYFGDGNNDFCPSIQLNKNDYIFPRISYSLMNLIEATRKGKVNATTGLTYNILANVYPWTTGYEIIDYLQTLNI